MSDEFDLEFEFDKELILPAYQHLIDSKDRVILLYGGRDSGKSHYAAQKLIIDCLRLPYFKCILVKKTYESIKDSQYETIKTLLEDWGIDHHFTFNVSPLKITCKLNGATFIARGCDKVGKIKSMKDPSHVWYEEGNQITSDDYATISTSLRSSKAEYLQEIFSFNPECEEGYDDFWIYKKWFKDKPKSYREKRQFEVIIGKKKIKVDLWVTALHTTYSDNRYCTPERIALLESFKNVDLYWYQVYTLGEWGYKKIENPFATQYDPIRHESTDAVYQPSKQVILVVDFNRNPFCATLHHYWRDEQGEHAHQFTEIEIEGGTIIKMSDRVKQVISPAQLLTLRISGDFKGNDAQIGKEDNNSLFTELMIALGIRETQLVPVTNPRHKESRINYNYMLAYFDDFKINPDTCPKTCRDMKIVVCDSSGGIKKANRRKVAELADFLDCQRYFENTFLYDWRISHQKHRA